MRTTTVDADSRGAVAIERRFDLVRGMREESRGHFSAVAWQLLGLDDDAKASLRFERRDQPRESSGETSEHPLGPRRPEPRKPQHRSTRIQPVRCANLPATPD